MVKELSTQVWINRGREQEVEMGEGERLRECWLTGFKHSECCFRHSLLRPFVRVFLQVWHCLCKACD